jgi:hypothetical protein
VTNTSNCNTNFVIFNDFFNKVTLILSNCSKTVDLACKSNFFSQKLQQTSIIKEGPLVFVTLLGTCDLSTRCELARLFLFVKTNLQMPKIFDSC